MAQDEPVVNDEPQLEEQADTQDGKKLNRAEKKCKKALIKMGLKSITGITRVSVKRRDGLIFIIQDPEVFKSPTAEGTKDSYVILGEMKMDEPKIDDSALKRGGDHHGHDHHGHDHHGHDHSHKEEGKISEVASAPKEAATVVEDTEPLSEEGLNPMHIEMVMQNANCTRNQAIKALRETNDDMVSAIMHLTK